MFRSLLPALLVVTLTSACAGSPIAPAAIPQAVTAIGVSPASLHTVSDAARFAAPAMDGGSAQAASTPLVLGLSGQSNAGRIRPFLEARATVAGNAAAGTGISCWADVPHVDNDYAGLCWAGLQPLLAARRDFDAFVWWQGDTELDHPTTYTAALADLVRRVRADTQNPRLLIVVLQLGAVNGDDPEGAGAQARTWAQRDPDAIYLETRDKEYQADRQHMTDQGYRDVVERIVAAVHAKVGR
jgi:hypothetical protein